MANCLATSSWVNFARAIAATTLSEFHFLIQGSVPYTVASVNSIEPQVGQ